jgi:mycoredoxin
MTEQIILYGSPTCGMVSPIRDLLDRVGVDYEYADISQDPEARRKVQEINDGNATVPTILFPNGVTLTEPSTRDVRVMLRSLGYEGAQLTAQEQVLMFLVSPLALVLGSGILVAGLAAEVFWLAGMGATLLFAALLTRLLVRSR